MTTLKCSMLLPAVFSLVLVGCAHTRRPETAVTASRSTNPCGQTTAAGSETAPTQPPQESEFVGACEVCVYVIENKEQHQPYLCRGLKDPNYQKNCVQVLESLIWWLSNEVYWLNYGCQREENGNVEWVRPCPAHAVCSWIENLYTRAPFCPADPYYKKPTQEDVDQLSSR